MGGEALLWGSCPFEPMNRFRNNLGVLEGPDSRAERLQCRSIPLTWRPCSSWLICFSFFSRRARSAHFGWGNRGAAAEKSLKFVRRVSPAGGAWGRAGSGLVLEYDNGVFRLKVRVGKAPAALSDECVWVCSACRLPTCTYASSRLWMMVLVCINPESLIMKQLCKCCI